MFNNLVTDISRPRMRSEGAYKQYVSNANEQENAHTTIKHHPWCFSMFACRSQGSFAAASNVTGALEDTEKISRILHRGGALSFWDYATAAPYVEINMNPEGSAAEDKVVRPARQAVVPPCCILDE